MRFRITNDEALRRLARGVPAEMRRGMLRFVTYAEGRAMGIVPTVSGNLRASITSGIEGEADGYLTATAPYAVFVHEGTGRYGPAGQDIVPKQAKALAFFWMGKQRFFRRVRGVKPRPFFTQAIEQAAADLPGGKLFGETL